MNLPDSIALLIQDIPATQAFEIIKNLGNPKVNVFSNGQLFNVEDIVAEDGVKSLRACDVGPFLFWGGPPKKLKYYNGNLYTLLCDRIMDRIQTRGLQAALEVISAPMLERVRVCL